MIEKSFGLSSLAAFALASSTFADSQTDATSGEIYWGESEIRLSGDVISGTDEDDDGTNDTWVIDITPDDPDDDNEETIQDFSEPDFAGSLRSGVGVDVEVEWVEGGPHRVEDWNGIGG